MPQTLSRAVSNRRNRGITLIEMSVVVMVILIMAALIERNFSHVKEGLAQRAFTSSLRSEVIRARLTAIQDGKTVTMQYDPAGSTFTLSEPTTDTTSSNQAPIKITDLQSQPTESVHSIPIAPGITFSTFRIGTNDTGNGDWKLHFYPEGRSDGGGVQMMVGKVTESLLIDPHGLPTYVSGPLPDASNDVWQSGTYEQRATS